MQEYLGIFNPAMSSFRLLDAWCQALRTTGVILTLPPQLVGVISGRVMFRDITFNGVRTTHAGASHPQ